MAYFVQEIQNDSASDPYGASLEASREIRVYSTDLTKGAVAAIRNCGHSKGESHPDEPNLRINNISSSSLQANKVPDGPLAGQRCRAWTITLSYGALSPLEGEFADNPLGMPVIWTCNPEFDEVRTLIDFDGKLILNTAGDRFDPSLKVRRYRGVYTGRVNLAMNDVTLPGLEALSNRTNLDAVGPFPPGTLRSTFFSLPEPVYFPASNYKYYPMTFDFEYNPDTWIEKRKNAGYNQIDAEGNYVKIYDDQGRDIDEPWFLNEDGGKLAKPFDPEDTIDLEFRMNEAINFASEFDFITNWVNV